MQTPCSKETLVFQSMVPFAFAFAAGRLITCYRAEGNHTTVFSAGSYSRDSQYKYMLAHMLRGLLVRRHLLPTSPSLAVGLGQRSLHAWVPHLEEMFYSTRSVTHARRPCFLRGSPVNVGVTNTIMNISTEHHARIHTRARSYEKQASCGFGCYSWGCWIPVA